MSGLKPNDEFIYLNNNNYSNSEPFNPDKLIELSKKMRKEIFRVIIDNHLKESDVWEISELYTDGTKRLVMCQKTCDDLIEKNIINKNQIEVKKND